MGRTPLTTTLEPVGGRQLVRLQGATEHPSERTWWCVSEGAQGATPQTSLITAA